MPIKTSSKSEKPSRPAKPLSQVGSGPGIVKIAGIQMASGPHVSANLAEAERLIEIAAEQGAKLVALPEYFAIMGIKDT
ncbi:MAG TPA: nitrilase-related carbon-nitrogen hydrolase, partial [Methylophilaceae bacterium]